MGIWKAFFNNTRKPEGLLGKCMVGSNETMPMPPSRIGLLVICRKQVRPRLRSWAVAVVGTFGRFCENIRLRLLLLWTIQK